MDNALRKLGTRDGLAPLSSRLECVDTGERATPMQWAKAIAAKRGCSASSVYSRLLAATKNGLGEAYGLRWRRLTGLQGGQS